MPIRFTCPACDKELEAPDSAAGVTAPCPYCSAQITAPADSGQPAAMAQPPAPPAGAAPAAPGAPPAYPGGAPAYPAAPPPYPGAPPAYPGMPPAYADAPGIGTYPTEPGLLVAGSGRLDLWAILSEAWQVTMANAGPIIGGYVIASMAVGAVTYAVLLPVQLLAMGGTAVFTNPSAPPPTPHPAGIIAFILAYVLVIAATLPANLGPLYVADQALSRGRADLNVLLRGYRHWPALLGGVCLFSLALIPSTLLLIVPGCIIGAGLSLMIMEMVDRRAGALEAMQTSWEATAGYRLQIFGISLVLWLIGIAGVFVCCVGQLVTYPLMMVGYAIMYRELRGLKGAMV